MYCMKCLCMCLRVLICLKAVCLIISTLWIDASFTPFSKMLMRNPFLGATPELDKNDYSLQSMCYYGIKGC